MKTIALALLLGVVGCKGKSESASASCDSAGDGVKAYYTKKATTETDDALKTNATQMADVASKRLVRHCKDDKWSDAAVTCMKSNETESGLEACKDKLTTAQMDKLKAEAAPLTAPHTMDDTKH